MDKWNPMEPWQSALVPQIFGMIVITIVLSILALCYYKQVKNAKVTDTPKKLTLLVDMLIDTIKKLIIETFGVKFIKLTPYFIFLLSYLAFGNLLSIFGLKEPSTSYSVPLALGMITWVTSIFFSIKYQRMSFLQKFLFSIKIKGNKIYFPIVNPLELLGKVTPLISISFRIWGNIIAGSIIFSVLFWGFGQLTGAYPQIGIILIGGVVMMPFLFAYLTIFIGIVQAYVFALLTMTYWSGPINEGLDYQKELALKKQNKLEKENLQII